LSVSEHNGSSRLQLTALYVIEFSNGKRYFGITNRNPADRWRDHLKASRKYDRRICRAIRKHGGTLRVLVRGRPDYIKELEISAIAAFKTCDWQFGYNTALGGDLNPMDGRRHTPEAIAKIAAASRARVRRPESNAKTSATLRGRKHSEERRQAVSAATKVAMASPEVRAKLHRKRSVTVVPGFS